MKRIIAVLLILIVMLAVPAAVSAGSASLSFSGDKEAVCGERFSVMLVFKSSSERIDALQASFSYSSSLKFLGGGNAVSASGGKGSISDSGGEKEMRYALEFRAEKTGKVHIEVFDTELIGESGKLIGNPSGSVTISVSEKTAEAPAEDPEQPEELPEEELPEETEDPAEDPAEAPAEDVMVIGGEKYVLMDQDGIPGFLVLGDQDGALLLYRTSDGTFSEYMTHRNRAAYGYSALPELTDKTPTSVEINGVMREAYAAEGDFYYVFLTDAEGTAAWYVYDAAEGTLQRAAAEQNIVELPAEDDGTGRMIRNASLVIGGGILVTLICLILIARRKRR